MEKDGQVVQIDIDFFVYILQYNSSMKKLVFVLLLIIPMGAVADRRSDFVNKILEYENTQIDNNAAQINAYGVNQEKLDMYRAAHRKDRIAVSSSISGRIYCRNITRY